MEGLWSVVFNVPGRPPVYGIVVFVGDRIFGADPFFYWIGNYRSQAGKLEGTLDSFSHSGKPVSNIFGQTVGSYSVPLSAPAPASEAIGASFAVNGPAGLTATLTRRA
jgi:hypothetical protein